MSYSHDDLRREVRSAVIEHQTSKEAAEALGKILGFGLALIIAIYIAAAIAVIALVVFAVWFWWMWLKRAPTFGAIVLGIIFVIAVTTAPLINWGELTVAGNSLDVLHLGFGRDVDRVIQVMLVGIAITVPLGPVYGRVMVRALEWCERSKTRRGKFGVPFQILFGGIPLLISMAAYFVLDGLAVQNTGTVNAGSSGLLLLTGFGGVLTARSLYLRFGVRRASRPQKKRNEEGQTMQLASKPRYAQSVEVTNTSAASDHPANITHGALSVIIDQCKAAHAHGRLTEADLDWVTENLSPAGGLYMARRDEEPFFWRLAVATAVRDNLISTNLSEMLELEPWGFTQNLQDESDLDDDLEAVAVAMVLDQATELFIARKIGEDAFIWLGLALEPGRTLRKSATDKKAMTAATMRAMHEKLITVSEAKEFMAMFAE